MKNFSDNSIKFIVRAKENRKYVELKFFIKQDASNDLDSLILIKDTTVNLYTGVPMATKKGTIRYKETLIEEPFRLIIAQSKDDPDKQFWLVTNEFYLSAKQITDAYRRRWDIEVFFGSLNKN